MTRFIERNGSTFRISGKFGNISVYRGLNCLVFGLMTANDAENWIWANY
jgi:hypothetical protein